jgi:D-sedoheptulose 7-phosphate isomerase
MMGLEFAELFLEDFSSIAMTMDRGQIVALGDLIYDAWLNDATVFVCGNGGSAATASHLAADLAKFTQNEGRRPLRALSLCDAAPLISALVNDLGPASVYLEQLRTHYRPGDVLLALSVHGGAGADRAGPWSQNLLAAAAFVRERGGRVASLTGFDGGGLAKLSDVPVIIPAAASGRLTTPLVESMHVAIHHLICADLKDRIAAHSGDA